MKKKFIGVMLVVAMAVGPVGCGGSGGTNTGATVADAQATEAQREEARDDIEKEDEKEDSEASNSEGASDFHIGVITGPVSQPEDDRCGAEAFQAMYGEDMVRLATYPGDFTEELETIVQIIANLSDDPKMEAIIMNQSVPGTTGAFRKIKETCPGIPCVVGEDHEDFPEIGSAVDLVCNNDFVARGYLIIRTAHELDHDTLVRISSPRHVAYKTVNRRMAVMKEVCKEFGMEFVLGTAPDPTSDVDVAGAQTCTLEKVPEWVKKYNENTAYLCTSDVHTEPLLKQLTECDGYSIEADPPSPLMDYPGALGIDLTAEAGDFDKTLARVEPTIVKRDGVDHLGTQAYPYGYITSAGLAQHALNVLSSESELDDIDDIAKIYQVFSPKVEWNGSDYTGVETDAKLDNVFLVYQDTYITGDLGHFMDSIKIEVSEKYFTVKQDIYQ